MTKKTKCIITLIVIIVIAVVVGVVVTRKMDEDERRKEREEQRLEEKRETEKTKERLTYMCDNLFQSKGLEGWYPGISDNEGCENYVCYYSYRSPNIFKLNCKSKDKEIKKVDNPKKMTVKEYMDYIS